MAATNLENAMSVPVWEHHRPPPLHNDDHDTDHNLSMAIDDLLSHVNQFSLQRTDQDAAVEGPADPLPQTLCTPPKLSGSSATATTSALLDRTNRLVPNMTPFRTKQPQSRSEHDTAALPVVALEAKRPEAFKTAIPLGTDESVDASILTARDLDEIPLHSTARASATTQQLPLDDDAKVRAWAQRVRFTCVQWVQQHQRLLARQYEQLHYEQAQWQQYRAKQERERRSPAGANA
jgi:hypothetical protein